MLVAPSIVSGSACRPKKLDYGCKKPGVMPGSFLLLRCEQYVQEPDNVLPSLLVELPEHLQDNPFALTQLGLFRRLALVALHLFLHQHVSLHSTRSDARCQHRHRPKHPGNGRLSAQRSVPPAPSGEFYVGIRNRKEPGRVARRRCSPS